MGSSEFLYVLLSTIDNSYKKDFSLRTKLLLGFCKLIFPRYIKISANSRLELKKEIIKSVKKSHPNIIIELGAGHSEDYIPLLRKNLKKLVQVDRENISKDVKEKSYFY
ncbi:MAG: hypothetical protein AABX66_00380 [Nanoarchaeota archaeon]